MSIMVGSSKSKLYIGSTKIRRAYLGTQQVYSSGNIVTYVVDGSVTYTEEVDEGATVLSPKSFVPAKSGWTFLGWRQDTTATSTVLSSLTMGDNPITLYAVFRQTVTLSYNGNGATSGSTASQTGYRYYNNANVVNYTVTIQSNGYIRTGYNFLRWRQGSASGTAVNPGSTLTLSASTTLYAEWFVSTLVGFDYNNPGSYNTTYIGMGGEISNGRLSSGAGINDSPPYNRNKNPDEDTATLTINQISPYSKVELVFEARGINDYLTSRVAEAELSGAISGRYSTHNYGSGQTIPDTINNKTFTMTSAGTINMRTKAVINGDNNGTFTSVESYLTIKSITFKI